ncbi:MAG: RyR domain-containing protein [Muribaculum sp.]|nr:RyR domain-containing protein [Muribaculum sp.]
MKQYIPAPIDTEQVELSAELRQLVEKLAENTHDVWARQRFQDGWTYGPNRDDEQKTHPCLVAYGELPDSEKAYDRAVAEQTIKAMLAMGYRIGGKGEV